MEALYFGNVLVMSKKLVSTFDLTEDGRAGFAVEGERACAWADKLAALMQNSKELSEYSRKSNEHFHDKFVWKNILKTLHTRIAEIRD